MEPLLHCDFCSLASNKQGRCFLSKVQHFAMLRLNKLIRIIEMPTLVDNVERTAVKFGLRFNKNLLRVSKLMCRLLIASHAFACAFFLIASWENHKGNCNNWAFDARLITACGDGRTCGSAPYAVADAYILSLYWAVATLTTVGYGDIHASKGSAIEVIFCTFVMIIGTFFIYTLIIANLEEIVSQLDVTQSIFKHRADKLRQFCVRRKLPEDLASKIDEYLAKLWVQQRGIRGTALLHYLPPSLHSQVVSELVGEKLGRLFFVRTCDRNFVDELTIGMDLELCAPNDIIFRTGQPAQKLFLMVKGTAALLEESCGTIFTTLKDCTLGEGEFFARATYPCSCRLTSTSEMFMLDFSVLWRILESRKLTEKYTKALCEQTDTLHRLSTLSLIEKVRLNLENKKMARMMMANEVTEKEGFAIAPSSIFYKSWKILALLFAIYSGISVPKDIAFSATHDAQLLPDADANMELFYIIIEISFILFFIVDILLHLFVFMCKYEGRLISERREFRQIYVRRKLAIDLLSTLPISIMFHRVSAEGSLSFTYSLLRLFQLTRVARIGDYFQTFVSVAEEMLNLRITSTGVRRLIDWIPLTLLFNHWVACMFYLISQLNEGESWVTQWMIECKQQKVALSGFQCTSYDVYLRAFYWALYTLTTTGYGQVIIVSNEERIFAMFVMVLGGVMCDAGITAILTALFNEEDRESATRKRQIECTTKYLSSNNYGASMKTQVLDYFRYVDEELHNLVDKEVVSYLPSSLQHDLASHFCFQSLRSSQMFKSSPDSTIHYFVSRMEPYLAVPNEQLQCGNMNEEVLFVLIRGRVQSTCITGETETLLPGSLVSNCENRARAKSSGVLERKIHVKVLGASGLPKTNTMGAPDPFAVLDFELRKHRTATRKATRSPKWNEEYTIWLPSSVTHVVAKVMNFESVKKDIQIGQVEVDISHLTAEGADVDDLMADYQLVGATKNPCGKLKMGLTAAELKPWEVVQIPETTVTAVSFAQLYKLDMAHCSKLKDFQLNLSAPPHSRLPAPRRLGLSPADGRRIINSCKSLDEATSDRCTPLHKEEFISSVPTEPTWKEEKLKRCAGLQASNYAKVHNDSASSAEENNLPVDHLSDAELEADVDATNLSTSDETVDGFSSFSAFDAYMEDAFFRHGPQIEARALPVGNRARKFIEKILGLVNSRVYPG
jgi:hypothetical protein